MLISRLKRKENIAEYLIYMWQIEDQIRALNLDINLIEELIISKYNHPEALKSEIKDWYENLILLIKHEGITKEGHLQITKNILSDLHNTHIYLLQTASEIKYQSLYYKAKMDIEALKHKTKKDGDIEACFQFLYGTMLLRLKGDKLKTDTEKSLKNISSLIALLSKKHLDLESGNIEIKL